jgi:hypothetical protein
MWHAGLLTTPRFSELRVRARYKKVYSSKQIKRRRRRRRGYCFDFSVTLIIFLIEHNPKKTEYFELKRRSLIN